jgi:hypothetical protein
MTAARAIPGVGALGVGAPLPQVASVHVVGNTSGDSTAWTIDAPTLSLPEATAWGTRPPRTAAANTATRPTRHFMPMPCRLEGPPKRQLRTPESPLRNLELFVAASVRRAGGTSAQGPGRSCSRKGRDGLLGTPRVRTPWPGAAPHPNGNPSQTGLQPTTPPDVPGHEADGHEAPDSGHHCELGHLISCPRRSMPIPVCRRDRTPVKRSLPESVPGPPPQTLSGEDPRFNSAQIPVRKRPLEVRLPLQSWRLAVPPCVPTGPPAATGRGTPATRSG